MNQKRILVTGASGAIGSSLCRYLASRGYALVLAARNSDRLQQQAKELEALSRGKHAAISFDFSDKESCQRLATTIGGTLDGLVLMPPQIPATAECLPDDALWGAHFQTSFIGPLELIRNCIPLLKKSSRSKVVIVSGISSLNVMPNYATSNVLRTAWLAEAKTLAYAFGKDRIHFNTLSLGGVMTDKYRARLQTRAQDKGRTFEEQYKDETSNVPLDKYATTDEVSFAIEGLLSAFSDHMTGANIPLDGGFTRGY